VSFRIYYGDGPIYEGDPFYAPATGVQVIATEKPLGGWWIAKQKEAWYWKDERWNACDTAGMYDYLMSHLGPQKIIFGRSIRDDKFWEIVAEAERDCG